MSIRRLRFRDLPLFAKVLLPFLALMATFGVFGGWLIVRDLSSRAEQRLEQSLADRSLEARSLIQDRELYLIESANLSANLVGIAEAIDAHDVRGTARLLQSVLALKTELNVVAALDERGRGVVQFARAAPGKDAVRTRGAAWGPGTVVARAMADPKLGKFAAFTDVGGARMLVIAAPVCVSHDECTVVGAAVVGITVERLAAAGLGSDADARSSSLSFYDPAGARLASVGPHEGEPSAPRLGGEGLLRRTRNVGGTEVATLYAPLVVQGKPAGTLAVSLPTGPAFSSVRGAGWRLAGIVAAAMFGVVAIGTLLSRFILARVRTLLETNRALGRGELSARAPVQGEDELGELARGVNQMAEQLQASHETLELRVEQRTQEIERLLRERTDFFTGLSHEFRTPLAVILRHAELMLDPTYVKNGKRTREIGSAVKYSAEQLLGLVNDILDLARAEAGRIDVHPSDVSLPDLIAELRPTIEGLARGSGLSVAVEVPRDLPAAHADRARLRQILLNLIDNAVKYTPEGGRIALGARAREDGIAIWVSDTGVGIPSDSITQIFEPFFRVRTTTTQLGQASSGIGLALTRRLVEAHGGTISASSVPGEGSTFTIVLPAATPGGRGGAGRRSRTGVPVGRA